MTVYAPGGIVLSMVRSSTALALALVATTASAQDAPQPPPISVSTRLVQIGVIVRDKNGPVADLTKDDFVVLDRGKPQKISVFSVESPGVASAPAHPLPQNTFSDLPQYGATSLRSITVVLLDNLNTLYGSASEDQYESTPYWVEDLALQNAKTHLIQFLEQLGPQDRVAIYGLTDSLHVLCDFTSDRGQLIAVLKEYDTISKTNREIVEPGLRHPPVLGQEADPFENEASATLAGMANGGRARTTMAALMSIAAHVANIPGRKNLVWLTANLPFSGAAMARILSPARIAAYPIDARGLLTRTPPRSGADIVDFDAAVLGRGAPAQSLQPIGIDTMQQLADETGGKAFVNTNDITGAIRKAVEDSAVIYTFGFYIDRASIDGKFHELKVKAKPRDLTVLYPKGYLAFEDMPATKEQDQNSMETAVRSPLESSAIPLQAKVDRVEQPLPHSFDVLGSIDIHSLRFVQDGSVRKGAVELAIVEQNETGKVLGQSGRRINLQFTEQQFAACLKSGLPFHQHAKSLAGVTTLRILVEDPSTAEVGSLIIPLSQLK
jgi:VWFA-related protein